MALVPFLQEEGADPREQGEQGGPNDREDTAKHSKSGHVLHLPFVGLSRGFGVLGFDFINNIFRLNLCQRAWARLLRPLHAASGSPGPGSCYLMLYLD